MPNLGNFLGAGGIVTALLFSGVIILISEFISKKLTKGRLHPSAIAIFFGLVLAYVGGVIAGGEKGLGMWRLSAAWASWAAAPCGISPSSHLPTVQALTK